MYANSDVEFSGVTYAALYLTEVIAYSYVDFKSRIIFSGTPFSPKLQ